MNIIAIRKQFAPMDSAIFHACVLSGIQATGQCAWILTSVQWERAGTFD